MTDATPSRVDLLAADTLDYYELFSRFRAEAGVDDREFALLAGLASMMIMNDGGDGARFAPFIEFADGSTSFTVGQLTHTDIEHLRAVKTTNAALRARISDVIWELVDGKERVEHVHAAIDAYVEMASDLDWYESEEVLHRAIDLAKRFRGSDKGARRDRIHALIRASFDAPSESPADLLTRCELLRAVGAAKDDQPLVIAALEAAQIAAEQDENFGFGRRIIEEQLLWTEDEDQKADLSSKVAELWELEADFRLQPEHRSAFVAASFLEEAIQVLRSIPRKHRERLNVEERITALRSRMRDLNLEAIDEMTVIDSPEFTVQGMSEQARAQVRGRSTHEALERFARLIPWASEADDRTTAEQSLEGTITRLLPTTSLTNDGRVADKSDAEEAVDREVSQNAQRSRQIMTVGILLPALQQMRSEHVLTQEVFFRIAQASTVVPPGHERLYASGLWAGWNYDFGVSVHVLTPRIEALVRYHLKAAGVLTTHLTQEGIDDELSLPSLLEKPEAKEVFGEHILYELQGLYSGRFGTNLRHQIAHGLVDDSVRKATTSVYAWWSTLRLVMIPFFNRKTAEGASPEAGQ